MELKINQVAKLTGITVRTLHYYDQIGLLPPGAVTESGYRLYGRGSWTHSSKFCFSGSLISLCRRSNAL